MTGQPEKLAGRVHLVWTEKVGVRVAQWVGWSHDRLSDAIKAAKKEVGLKCD